MRSGLSAPRQSGSQASAPAAPANRFTPERKETVCFPAAPVVYFYSALDTYDREVFESMGVKTIWVDRFEEVPDVISAIAP